jgi:hypothetical protein
MGGNDGGLAGGFTWPVPANFGRGPAVFFCALGVRLRPVESQFVKFVSQSLGGEKIRAGNDIDSLPEDS